MSRHVCLTSTAIQSRGYLQPARWLEESTEHAVSVAVPSQTVSCLVVLQAETPLTSLGRSERQSPQADSSTQRNLPGSTFSREIGAVNTSIAAVFSEETGSKRRHDTQRPPLLSTMEHTVLNGIHFIHKQRDLCQFQDDIDVAARQDNRVFQVPFSFLFCANGLMTACTALLKRQLRYSATLQCTVID